MTIKNKKTKQSSNVSSASTSASTSVQKSSSTSKTVQQSSSSSSTQKVVSSGKQVRIIDVKVEEDDPLMITDVTHDDHASVCSTVSELYNSHPHYIITEAPSMTDVSQIKSKEFHVSDMALAQTGEFVSSAALQQSSTSHQQSSSSETFQSSSSTQQSGATHSQSFDRTVDTSAGSQTMNTAFIDNSASNMSSNNSFVNKSHGANTTNSFLEAERQSLAQQSTHHSSSKDSALNTKITSQNFTSDNQNNSYRRDNITSRNSPGSTRGSPAPSGRNQIVKTDSSKFFGNEGTLDKNVKTKEYSSTSQSSESKSSSVTKSSSSSYVVEIVDGKERIIDSSKREWGDAKEQAHKEAYASISGTDIKPQSVHSTHNYDMKSKFDTGKDGKPSSQMSIKEDSKLIKDGNQITTHSSLISEKDNVRQKQLNSTQEHLSSDTRNVRESNSTSDRISSEKILSSKINEQQQQSTSKSDRNSSEKILTSKTTSERASDNKQRSNKTDSSNFYGYDATIQNELRKVGDILQVADAKDFNFSSKILKSNTSSAQQASTSSYTFEVVDGKERIIDSSHREWGDSKDHGSFETSQSISGTNIKPQHEYSRHVLEKESHYDTGNDGIPKSSTQITEESLLVKDGKEVASKTNTYVGDFTKKRAVTEHADDVTDFSRKQLSDISEHNVSSSGYQSSTDTQQYSSDSTNVVNTTEFLTTEKQNLAKESTSKSDSKTSTVKETLTSYERGTGTWNGKFVYEKDDDRKKKPKELSPFGRPELPRHHLKRQDTEENIILSSRDIKDFTSISDLRKIIETSQFRKDVKVSDKSIVINRNIDDRVLKEIIETVKKYPFKRIEKVTFGTKINEDVKDLYEGIDTEQTTILKTSSADITKKSFEVEKTKSQIEVTRYITENGVTTKITTYEDAKEDDKVKTNVFVDKSSSLDIKNLVSL